MVLTIQQIFSIGVVGRKSVGCRVILTTLGQICLDLYIVFVIMGGIDIQMGMYLLYFKIVYRC